MARSLTLVLVLVVAVAAASVDAYSHKTMFRCFVCQSMMGRLASAAKEISEHDSTSGLEAPDWPVDKLQELCESKQYLGAKFYSSVKEDSGDMVDLKKLRKEYQSLKDGKTPVSSASHLDEDLDSVGMSPFFRNPPAMRALDEVQFCKHVLSNDKLDEIAAVAEYPNDDALLKFRRIWDNKQGFLCREVCKDEGDNSEGDMNSEGGMPDPADEEQQPMSEVEQAAQEQADTKSSSDDDDDNDDWWWDWLFGDDDDESEESESESSSGITLSFGCLFGWFC